MRIEFKNKPLERSLIVLNGIAAALVAATFVCLFGFEDPLLLKHLLYGAQYALLGFFILEKVVRFFNSASKREYIRNNWFEFPLLVIVGIFVIGSGHWFGKDRPEDIRHIAVGIYLVLQIISKVGRTVIDLASSGRNPTRMLITSFLILILVGAGFLMLPKSSTGERVGFVDALFTATTSTCVTGLTVKDTGRDFTMMGQLVILSLIQLGGLGIVIFGAIFALLLRQAFTLRESVAMQDLLSSETLSTINKMIAFIFAATVLIEGIGAVCLFPMWDKVPTWTGDINDKWFYSIFHSVSAFCNAGLGLISDNLVQYSKSYGVFLVICPLIVLGGIGFSVLYNIFDVSVEKIKSIFRKEVTVSAVAAHKKIRLQSKIAITATILLIVFGTLFIFIFDKYSIKEDPNQETGILDALFQSVTARTAGFNTINIKAMSGASKLIMIVLMWIGGSPGGTAGGIKTVTFAVVIMTAIAALRKRQDVEMFKRSIRLEIVGRAITIMLLYTAVQLAGTLALSVTERASDFAMMDIGFEAGSAMGTVGLSTGITASLTTAGKLVIIALMLIGRLGPLTLLAALTFEERPARYNYPTEAIMVG